MMDVKKTQLFLRGVIAHPSMLVTILISTFFFCRILQNVFDTWS